MRKKVKQVKYERIPLRPGLGIALISAGRDNNLGVPKVPSGMMVRVDLTKLLGEKITKKINVGAYSFAFDRSEVKKLAKKMLKAMET